MGTLSKREYGLRRGAEKFPLQVIISIIYPCNFGCPYCPYTDGNSELRKFYRQNKADLLPIELWHKMADECGIYGAWMRCTGGGEPMLHPQMVDMIEYAKAKGARIWLNTNGSVFGPSVKMRQKLQRIIQANIDLIEFSMDAGDAETYAMVRPPRGGEPRNPDQWWKNHLDNIQTALEYRKELKTTTRIVVSIIQQQAIEDKLEDAIRFWLNKVGVDDVITRKFLTWDNNTSMDFDPSLDPHLYADLPSEKKKPCVWPFERLNVDTLGRIALCGQDIAFNTSNLFPTLWESSIQEIWQGERFHWYRQMHLEGRGAEVSPCRGCSAWLAGVRDWDHGWLKVLKTSGDHLKEVMKKDHGVQIEIYEPKI